MKFLKLAFIHKKHDTLYYCTFLYKKIQTLRKKQDNLRYVFMFKNLDTLHYAIFHSIFEIGGGGGHFYLQKTIQFVLHFYIKKTNGLCVTFYIQKHDTMRYIFIYKNNALCITFLYLNFIVHSTHT